MGNVQSSWAKRKCFDLVEAGDVRKLEGMLQKRPKFCDARNGTRSDGMSLLILASFLDHPDKVEMLLRRGADPEKPCGYGVTALHMACLHGHGKVVRSLLAHGARPQSTDFFGQNALHYAASCPKLDRCRIVKLLIDTGMNLNGKDYHMRTALHMACLVHHLNTAEVLLVSGINLHVKDLVGREALSYIANEKIRDELAKSVVFVSAVQLHKIKPLLVVLQHKIFRFNSRQLELRSGLLKGDKAIDFRNVFNIEELRRKIVSYI